MPPQLELPLRRHEHRCAVLALRSNVDAFADDAAFKNHVVRLPTGLSAVHPAYVHDLPAFHRDDDSRDGAIDNLVGDSSIANGHVDPPVAAVGPYVRQLGSVGRARKSHAKTLEPRFADSGFSCSTDQEPSRDRRGAGFHGHGSTHRPSEVASGARETFRAELSGSRIEDAALDRALDNLRARERMRLGFDRVDRRVSEHRRRP